MQCTKDKLIQIETLSFFFFSFLCLSILQKYLKKKKVLLSIRLLNKPAKNNTALDVRKIVQFEKNNLKKNSKEDNK